jgi:hypothetical protein
MSQDLQGQTRYRQLFLYIFDPFGSTGSSNKKNKELGKKGRKKKKNWSPGPLSAWDARYGQGR